jgi:DNA-binding NarL/FixJ family response regulator
VLLLDRQELVHLGFETLLLDRDWVEVLLTAFVLDAATVLARRYRPHLAVVDTRLGNASPREACTRLQRASPRTRVLLMSSDSREDLAVVPGAAGFVPKNWSAQAIAHAVHAVGRGVAVFGSPVAEPRLLTDRETEVVRRMAAGDTNREIAVALQISPHTVKDHVKVVYRKLNARNRAEATMRAERLALLPRT